MRFFKKKEIEQKQKENEIEEQIDPVKTEPDLTKQNPVALELEKKKVDLDSKEDIEQFLHNSCEQIVEATTQLEDAKIEYEAVTSYLTDIQKIDSIPREEREVIEDAARKIITLIRERAKYQNRELKITPSQYQMMQRNEEIIPEEIKKLIDKESYQLVIKNDMMHLETEKKKLRKERKEITAQQKYLKKLAVITSILVFTLFVLFLLIAYETKSDMMIPYIMTIIMAAISAAYIFYEASKNRTNMALANRKLHRAIGLLNSVKIKYVNNSNNLDYTFHKFNITSSVELQYLWEEYKKIREENKKYQKNTEMLNSYNELLISELEKYQLKDTEVWIYQAAAIIDSREMVEIRHRLNVRRQKLRERMDYNSNLKDNSLNDIEMILKKKPELKPDIAEILKQYPIRL